MPIEELGRSSGFSDATFSKWRAKFDGMQATEAQRLRELEGDNAKLKRLLAKAHLDMLALKSVVGVKRQPHRSSARRSDGWLRSTACPSAARVVSWGFRATAIDIRRSPLRPRKP